MYIYGSAIHRTGIFMRLAARERKQDAYFLRCDDVHRGGSINVFTNLFHRANYHPYTHYSQHTFVHVISDFDALEVKTLTGGR